MCGIPAPEKLWPLIVADTGGGKRPLWHPGGEIVTRLADLSYNARFAGPLLTAGQVILPIPDRIHEQEESKRTNQ
ncbi:MAG TPA: hypothetical protein DD385_00840 [Marinobacter sp.]|nr:hypothetical protein [Marinobacter sp.]